MTPPLPPSPPFPASTAPDSAPAHTAGSRFDAALRVDDVLRSIAHRRVFFDPLSGNNGDRLIHMGSDLAIRGAGVTPVSSADEAEVIVINGGGGMIDESKNGIAALRAHLDHPNQPEVVVLPQSYKFETMDFASFFAQRTSPVTLFARERYSLGLLSELDLPETVRIGLDHDMAFRLAGSDFIDRLKARSARTHVLIVERADAEATTGLRHRAIGKREINRLIPAAIKRPIKRAIRARQAKRWAAQSAFVESMRARIVDRDPGAAGLPVVASDISDAGNADFDTFCSLITEAAAVATNRLHVGVLAALLGKPTFIAAASYHKIRGIYDHSMSGMPHVVFVS